uniref:Uncharacterized protein n=1 Tax=Rhizophora mucronata TaxID=61149 RepID=A0A2P2QWL5_RHIMU
MHWEQHEFSMCDGVKNCFLLGFFLWLVIYVTQLYFDLIYKFVINSCLGSLLKSLISDH